MTRSVCGSRSLALRSLLSDFITSYEKYAPWRNLFTLAPI